MNGEPMGSPLAPLLANFAMHMLETKFNLYNGSPPISYLRYIDDIFAVFPSDSDAHNFLSFLNSLHHQLKFTMETQDNDKLPFLDTLVCKADNKLNLSWYRKSCYTALQLPFCSINPITYKRSAFVVFAQTIARQTKPSIRRLKRKQLRIKFLEECEKQQLVPKFLQFKLPVHISHYQAFFTGGRLKCLRNVLKVSRHELSDTQKAFSHMLMENAVDEDLINLQCELQFK